MGTTDSTFQFRRLNSRDAQSLRDLNEVFAHAFEDPETHLSKTPDDGYLTKLLSKPHFIAIAAWKNGKVVGGLVAYVLEKVEQARSEVYLYDLAVAESHRRQGIARTLIEKLKFEAKSEGAWVIFVQADRVDEPAIRLYESLGVREEPFHFDIPV